MKKIISIFFISLSFFIFTGAQPKKQVKKIVIDEQQPINGPLFKAADTILLKGEINGDVFLAGGDILVDATINGDLIVVGGKVDIRGHIKDDLRVGGGQIDVNALVDDDVTIAGGQVTLDEDAKITNTLFVVGGLIEVNGQADNLIWLGGGQVRFNGQAKKDLTIEAENVDVFSKANVAGNFTINSVEDPVVSDQAIVSGELIKNKKIQSAAKKVNLKQPTLTKKFTGFMVVKKLAGLFFDILVGLLLIALLPKLTQELTKTAINKSSQALGWGFLKLLVVPIIGVFFMISLIGIPLAALIFMLYWFSLYFAKLVISLAIGTKIFNDNNFKKPYQSFVLGVIIVSVLKVIPVIGWLAYAILIILGLGTIALKEKTALKNFRRK